MAKILIAEDSKTTATQLRVVLERHGHEVVWVADGEQAKASLQSDRPDLVILDLMLPKLNGFAVCREIRSDARLKDLPVLMVTAMDRQSDRFWGLKQGANEYLTKPIDAAALLAKVEQYTRAPTK
jgi:twitching motility two-component system response regulator PilH